MKIAIIGASRNTGFEALKKALNEGHSVTAIARNPASITLQNSNLKVERGDVLDVASLKTAFRGQEAVLSALGVPIKPFQREEITLYSEGMKNIIAAMHSTGLTRLMCVSSSGTDPAPKTGPGSFIYNQFGKRMLAQQYEDLSRMEKIVADSPLNWTIVRATRLINKPATGIYRVGENYDLPGGRQIARGDVADFMLKELANPRYIRKAVILAY